MGNTINHANAEERNKYLSEHREEIVNELRAKIKEVLSDKEYEKDYKGVGITYTAQGPELIVRLAEKNKIDKNKLPKAIQDIEITYQKIGTSRFL
ncbi:MAG: hypothetical protein WCO66_04045 [Candidatus Absconditabacteria bacterium]